MIPSVIKIIINLDAIFVNKELFVLTNADIIIIMYTVDRKKDLFDLWILKK